jgi:hypothetical protein
MLQYGEVIKLFTIYLIVVTEYEWICILAFSGLCMLHWWFKCIGRTQHCQYRSLSRALYASLVVQVHWQDAALSVSLTLAGFVCFTGGSSALAGRSTVSIAHSRILYYSAHEGPKYIFEVSTQQLSVKR